MSRHVGLRAGRFVVSGVLLAILPTSAFAQTRGATIADGLYEAYAAAVCVSANKCAATFPAIPNTKRVAVTHASCTVTIEASPAQTGCTLRGLYLTKAGGGTKSFLVPVFISTPGPIEKTTGKQDQQGNITTTTSIPGGTKHYTANNQTMLLVGPNQQPSVSAQTNQPSGICGRIAMECQLGGIAKP